MLPNQFKPLTIRIANFATTIGHIFYTLSRVIRKGTYHCMADLLFCLDSAALIMLN